MLTGVMVSEQSFVYICIHKAYRLLRANISLQHSSRLLYANRLLCAITLQQANRLL